MMDLHGQRYDQKVDIEMVDKRQPDGETVRSGQRDGETGRWSDIMNLKLQLFVRMKRRKWKSCQGEGGETGDRQRPRPCLN